MKRDKVAYDEPLTERTSYAFPVGETSVGHGFDSIVVSS